MSIVIHFTIGVKLHIEGTFPNSVWTVMATISIKKAGKSYAEERSLVHKQFEAHEEIVVLNYIMTLSGISISCSRKNWNGQKARWQMREM